MLLFCIEVFIALYVKDNFVRPYLGDVLVVILIYCFIKAFFRFPVFPTAVGVLVFAVSVEFLQYVKGIELLGLEKYQIARVVIGTSFSWIDILTYIFGIFIVFLVEGFVGQIKLRSLLGR